MSFLDLFRRPLAVAATVPLAYDGVVSPWQADPNYLGQVLVSELFPTAPAGPPTRGDAMGVPALARARNVVCQTVGRMPLVHMRGADVLPADQPSPVRQPEEGRPRFITLLWTADQMMFYGRSWWHVTGRYAAEGGSTVGRPRTFRLVLERDAVVDDAGQLVGIRTGRDTPNTPVKPGDGIRFDGPHEGILNYDRGTIRAAAALERTAGRTAANPVPTIELHQTTPDRLDKTEVDELIRQWMAARNSENGAVGYTPASLEAKVHGAPVEQLLIEGRKAAALDIARLVGVPAWAVDAPVDGSSLTYSNTPSRTRELLDYGVSAYVEAIAGRLSLDDVLPRGHWCRFDADQLLSLDFAGRAAAYKVAVESKVWSVDELRAIEHGTPLESTEESNA